MRKDRTVFSIDMKVRAKKWFDFGVKDRVVVDRDDYEWLKDQASKVYGLHNDRERMQAENMKLQTELTRFADGRGKSLSDLQRQKNRNKLLMGIIKDHDLYDVFLERVEGIRKKYAEREEQRMDAKLVREGIDWLGE